MRTARARTLQPQMKAPKLNLIQPKNLRMGVMSNDSFKFKIPPQRGLQKYLD
jgi:hypothetical protein